MSKSLPRLWLAGMTGNEVENITELTECYDYFDGLIFTDHLSTDGTAEILEKRRKAGRIIQRPFTRDHDISMSTWLNAGVMQNGDWYLYLDSQERINPEWLKTLRQDASQFATNGVGAVFWGRPYLVRYWDDQSFVGNPHCWPQPIRGSALDIQDESSVVRDEANNTVYFGKFLINKKNLDNSVLLHGIKYFLCYGRSNETQNIYAKFGAEVVRHHEDLRKAFRWYCQSELGIDIYSLDSWVEYMTRREWDQVFLDYAENEEPVKTLYRFKVLGQNREEILRNRHNWSIKTFFKTGDFVQLGTNFVGTKNRYAEQAGFPPE